MIKGAGPRGRIYCPHCFLTAVKKVIQVLFVDEGVLKIGMRTCTSDRILYLPGDFGSSLIHQFFSLRGLGRHIRCTQRGS